jgi:hypothetical protein
MSTPREPYSGTATIGATEYSLPAASTSLATLTSAPGNYELWLDLAALTASESYDLRIYEAVKSGGTKRLLDIVRLAGVQAEPIYVYPRVALRNGWDITLKKVAGTDRSIDWSIRSLSDSDIAAIKAKTDNLTGCSQRHSDRFGQCVGRANEPHDRARPHRCERERRQRGCDDAAGAHDLDPRCAARQP